MQKSKKRRYHRRFFGSRKSDLNLPSEEISSEIGSREYAVGAGDSKLVSELTIQQYNCSLEEMTPTKISVVSLVISIASAVWSVYTFLHLLQLDEANAIVAEANIKITPNATLIGGSNPGVFGDSVEFVFANVGKVAAEHLAVRIYESAFRGQFAPGLLWRERIMNSIEPGMSARIGATVLGYESDSGAKQLACAEKVILEVGKDKRAIIISISYIHRLGILGPKRIERVFMYGWVTGKEEVSSLLESDYKLIYDRLRDGQDTRGDKILQAYLKENPPSTD